MSKFFIKETQLKRLVKNLIKEQEKNNTQLLLETIEQYNETISLLNDCIKNQQQTINSPQQKEVIVENPVNKELEDIQRELSSNISHIYRDIADRSDQTYREIENRYDNLLRTIDSRLDKLESKTTEKTNNINERISLLMEDIKYIAEQKSIRFEKEDW